MRTEFTMRWESTLSEAGCDTAVFNDLGVEDPRVIAAGSLERSMALNRIGRRDAHKMPPLGSDLWWMRRDCRCWASGSNLWRAASSLSIHLKVGLL